MVNAAERWLAHRSVPKLNVMVRGDNHTTQRFYSRLGYGYDNVSVLSKRLSG